MVVYDIAAYGSMIADVGRTACYARALQARVSPGAAVLDIGTGSGILALLACRAGARKVYALEPDDVIQVAREAAAASGFADRVQFLQANSLAVDLPEPVDGIVADLHGVLPIFGTSIASLLDARDRFLKPGGWMIPSRESLFVAVISCPTRHASLIEPWQSEYGFDFSGARARTMNRWNRALVESKELVVAPQSWATLNYQELRTPSVSGKASWTLSRRVTAHGLCVWFGCEVAPGIGFSNSPTEEERHVYRQAFFPWPRSTELQVGDSVSVGLRADFVRPDYVWTWTTHVIDGDSGSIKAAYAQSTLQGTPISRERLRKRGHIFVPTTNDNVRIDRRILELMDDGLTVGDIAARVLSEYPLRLKDWTAALTRVGDLSERYSA